MFFPPASLPHDAYTALSMRTSQVVHRFVRYCRCFFAVVGAPPMFCAGDFSVGSKHMSFRISREGSLAVCSFRLTFSSASILSAPGSGGWPQHSSFACAYFFLSLPRDVRHRFSVLSRRLREKQFPVRCSWLGKEVTVLHVLTFVPSFSGRYFALRLRSFIWPCSRFSGCLLALYVYGT